MRRDATICLALIWVATWTRVTVMPANNGVEGEKKIDKYAYGSSDPTCQVLGNWKEMAEFSETFPMAVQTSDTFRVNIEIRITDVVDGKARDAKKFCADYYREWYAKEKMFFKPRGDHPLDIDALVQGRPRVDE